MSDSLSAKPPVFFIHGLWLHKESWNQWIDFFREHGYAASGASWPGDGANTEDSREHADMLAGHGVGEIADFIAKQVEALPTTPILIGHSFGGLLVQNLLGRDYGVAGVAIDSAPPRGVPDLPLSALKSAFPVLSNPFNFNRAVPLTEEEFRYGFANAVSETEAKELYETYAMPAPGRPLFQAATATLNPHSATAVNVANATRGPLLLIAGEKDNTAPTVLIESTLRLYHKSSSAVTEFKEFPNRGHSLVFDSGWREIAEYSLSWLQSKGF
jgi:pimeloyl-ACP methyl ester carboxylesterase